VLDTTMDPEKTAPFELGEGEDACLLIHGFTGSPWDLRPLGDALAARGYYVRAPRLPGHGLSPRSMLNVDARDWVAAVEDAVLRLGSKRRVFLAGLSMGALLALVMASRHPQRVHGLALMAPALEFRDATLGWVRRLRRFPLLPLVRPWVEKSASDIVDPRASGEAPILKAFPSVRLLDLLTLQDQAREAMRHVRAPALVVSARHDHVVSPAGAEELARGLVNASVRSVTLSRGAHILPRDVDSDVLFDEVSTFFDGLRGTGAR
jgi:carboxylesterase